MNMVIVVSMKAMRIMVTIVITLMIMVVTLHRSPSVKLAMA